MRVKSLFLKLRKYIPGFLGGIILLVAFNNCGKGFIISPDISESAVFFSRAPGETCEDALLKVYQNTYHPFLSQNCNTCHDVSGPGTGSFASADVPTSYASFSSLGVDKIDTQAVNENHHPPYTGAHNTDLINELHSYWSAAQEGYASCIAAPSPTPAPVPNPTPTPTPTPVSTPNPTPTPATTVTYSQLSATGGLFATYCFSCHNTQNPEGKLDMTIYSIAKSMSSQIKSRINNASNPMPTGGLLPQNQRDTINAWVDQGAPP
ncbi:MAG: hypothetical protein ACXWRE_06270 [Pseudobdellovibrionaceae bacterium]